MERTSLTWRHVRLLSYFVLSYGLIQSLLLIAHHATNPALLLTELLLCEGLALAGSPTNKRKRFDIAVFGIPLVFFAACVVATDSTTRFTLAVFALASSLTHAARVLRSQEG